MEFCSGCCLRCAVLLLLLLLPEVVLYPHCRGIMQVRTFFTAFSVVTLQSSIEAADARQTRAATEARQRECVHNSRVDSSIGHGSALSRTNQVLMIDPELLVSAKLVVLLDFVT